MKTSYRVGAISLVVLSSIGCDQATKFAATTMLAGSPRAYMDDMLRLELTHNRGAFLSVGETLSPLWRNLIFCVGVSVLLAGMLIYAVRSRHLSAWTTVALALCVAGGFSNLIDRLRSGGAVLDFINVGVGGLRTGIFNFADMAIMAGMALLFVSLIQGPVKK